MMHRVLLCMLLLSLAVAAFATEPDVNEPGENWSYSSDESGGGSAYMGVDIADVTAERLSALKLKEEHGAEITMVDSDAPAGKAGLLEHDVILSVNGNSIESAAQLRRVIKETPPGRIVTLGISRDGQPMTIKVQLADRRKSSWAPGKNEFNFQMPQISIPDVDLPISVVIAHSSLRSGLMVENITQQLGDFFGVKNGVGVLVRSVEKGSHGEKSGFRAGDVIVKVNGQLVHDASDFTHILKASSGASAAVVVVRDKKEQTLTLSIPEKKDSGHLVIENSFEMPEVSDEVQLAIGRAKDEIARVTPDIMEKIQQATRCATDSARRAAEQWREQERQAEKHLEAEQKRMQESERRMQEAQRRMQQRLQKRSHELSGDWAEI